MAAAAPEGELERATRYAKKVPGERPACMCGLVSSLPSVGFIAGRFSGSSTFVGLLASPCGPREFRKACGVIATLAELGADIPIIAFADAEATRRIWRGLTDVRLGTGALPGDTLPTAAQVAVVRVSAEEDAVPRPAHRTDGQQARSGDVGQPATPGNRVYVRENNDGTCTWLLGRTSRTYNADQSGRIGAIFTRFTLPAAQQRLQGKPWHSFTATEFAVARPGIFTEQELVAVAARLCAQPMSWDGHIRWPVPLHLARTTDQTHPGWRADDPL